MMPIL